MPGPGLLTIKALWNEPRFFPYKRLTFLAVDGGLVPYTPNSGKTDLRLAIVDRGDSKIQLGSRQLVRCNGMSPCLMYGWMTKGGKIEKKTICMVWDVLDRRFKEYDGGYLDVLKKLMYVPIGWGGV